MSFNEIDRASVLAEALPYIQKYTGKTIVVKYGGNAMISDELRQAVISDIILLHLVGIHVVVVHGGGPEINEMLKKIGKESKFVDGLRYTDEETMDIVQQVLCGRVNKNLVSTLNRTGGKALGLCGMDGNLFCAQQKDGGNAGNGEEVCLGNIQQALQGGFHSYPSLQGESPWPHRATNTFCRFMGDTSTSAARASASLTPLPRTATVLCRPIWWVDSTSSPRHT